MSCVMTSMNPHVNDTNVTLAMHMGIAVTYRYNYSADITTGELGADYV